MEPHFRVRIKNLDFEIEIESSDKKFVEEKLKDYALISFEQKQSVKSDAKPGFSNQSLAKILKDHNATTNQTQKFLGAAVYLSSKGKLSLKTSDITNALRDAGQTRLSNASECLNSNVKKGFLEKTSGNEFMVTVHGMEEFGIQNYL